MNEKRIDDFLKTHEPIAPDTPADEKVRILAAVANKSKPSWIRWSVAALVALTLVGVAAYWLPSDKTSNLVVSTNGEETLEEMMDLVFYESEEVGYDYISLAQAISD